MLATNSIQVEINARLSAALSPDSVPVDTAPQVPLGKEKPLPSGSGPTLGNTNQWSTVAAKNRDSSRLAVNSTQVNPPPPLLPDYPLHRRDLASPMW